MHLMLFYQNRNNVSVMGAGSVIVEQDMDDKGYVK